MPSVCVYDIGVAVNLMLLLHINWTTVILLLVKCCAWKPQ